jgi:hypothetical protein
MTQLEKRIQRLESLYLPDQPKVGMFLPEIRFLCEFPKVFPDPDAAPPIARMTYLKLKQRWDRHWVKNPLPNRRTTLSQTDRQK